MFTAFCTVAEGTKDFSGCNQLTQRSQSTICMIRGYQVEPIQYSIQSVGFCSPALVFFQLQLQVILAYSKERGCSGLSFWEAVCHQLPALGRQRETDKELSPQQSIQYVKGFSPPTANIKIGIIPLLALLAHLSSLDLRRLCITTL